MQKITPFLWFDTQAEEAANFYCGIFPNSKITKITHYGSTGQEIHGKPAGSVMTVDFELDGRAFTALNGGPNFAFSWAVSFQILCETQDEVDFYWEKLSADPEAGQCGWLQDKFGLSWQVTPRVLLEMTGEPDSEKSQRAFGAMMGMKKIDIAELKRAYEG